MVIDPTFDFRTDAAGKDPDTYSATLCRYHQLLWSKPLPSCVLFELVPTSRPPYYFSHSSEAGDFVCARGSRRQTRRSVRGSDHPRRGGRRAEHEDGRSEVCLCLGYE
jgi:hypothetical protein